mgnify:CR=1 FL=1
MLGRGGREEGGERFTRGRIQAVNYNVNGEYGNKFYYIVSHVFNLYKSRIINKQKKNVRAELEKKKKKESMNFIDST